MFVFDTTRFDVVTVYGFEANLIVANGSPDDTFVIVLIDFVPVVGKVRTAEVFVSKIPDNQTHITSDDAHTLTGLIPMRPFSSFTLLLKDVLRNMVNVSPVVNTAIRVPRTRVPSSVFSPSSNGMYTTLVVAAFLPRMISLVCGLFAFSA